MASDLRMTVQSGIRLPPYLGEDKGGVDAAWDELAKVLFQFSYVSGISASDAFVEKWVAKHLIKTNQVDRFESVKEYFRANPRHAAQWGRRMTTSVRKFARHDTYIYSDGIRDWFCGWSSDPIVPDPSKGRGHPEESCVDFAAQEVHGIGDGVR